MSYINEIPCQVVGVEKSTKKKPRKTRKTENNLTVQFRCYKFNKISMRFTVWLKKKKKRKRLSVQISVQFGFLLKVKRFYRKIKNKSEIEEKRYLYFRGLQLWCTIHCLKKETYQKRRTRPYKARTGVQICCFFQHLNLLDSNFKYLLLEWRFPRVELQYFDTVKYLIH